MKAISVLFFLIFAHFAIALPSTSYYALRSDHLDSFRAQSSTTNLRELERKEKYSLVELEPEQVMSITRHVHELEHNCGGLVDLSVDQADTRLDIYSNFQRFLQPVRLPPKSYRLQNREAAEQVLTQLDRNEYQQRLIEFSSFRNRFANSAEGVAAAEWLEQQARQLATNYLRPDLHIEKLATPRYQQASVVVRLPGRNSKRPGVLLGGHFDSYPGDRPAVDDDASGTIASLEVLRAVLASEIRWERDIYIAFYAAEEWGLHGSKVVAGEFKRRGIELEGVMQLDMIAYSRETDKHFSFVSDFTNADLTQFTKAIARQYLNTPADKITDTRCGYACSDHASWHRSSYRAVTPFEAEMENMNSALHTSRDTMELVDLEHAFRFVQLAAAFVAELAASQ